MTFLLMSHIPMSNHTSQHENVLINLTNPRVLKLRCRLLYSIQGKHYKNDFHIFVLRCIFSIIIVKNNIQFIFHFLFNCIFLTHELRVTS